MHKTPFYLHIILVVTILLCVSANSYAIVASTDDWQDFGRTLLYYWNSNRCYEPAWFSGQEELRYSFSYPPSAGKFLKLETFIKKSLENYAQDSIIWNKRIKLDIHPRYIMGLYLIKRFPDSQLSSIGQKFLEGCLESICLSEYGSESSWKQQLQANILKKGLENGKESNCHPFSISEWPFVLTYFVEFGDSMEIKQYARKLLAEICLSQYGVEPSLLHYNIIFHDQNDVNANEQVQVVDLLEKIGLAKDSQKFYEKILNETNSVDIATKVTKKLAKIKLDNSQKLQAWQTINFLLKKFSDNRPDLQDFNQFYTDFQKECEKKLDELINDFCAIDNPEEILQRCIEMDSLFNEEESIARWGTVANRCNDGSLPWECAQLYLDRHLFSKGRLDEAKKIAEKLSLSLNEIIRAKTSVILADIRYIKGEPNDAIALWEKASNIHRPTGMPDFFKELNIGQINIQALSTDEQRCVAMFLQAYNKLIDGDIEEGINQLLKVNALIEKLNGSSLYRQLKICVSPLLMLAYANISDYCQAEEYGLKTIINLQGTGRTSKTLTNFQEVERIDNFLLVLFKELRQTRGGSETKINDCITGIYKILFSPKTPDTDFEPLKNNLIQIFWNIKKRTVSQLLLAEYNLALRNLIDKGTFDIYLKLEQILFTSQIIKSESFEEVTPVFIANTPRIYSKGQLYRFAKFADGLGNTHITKLALDRSLKEINDVNNDSKLLHEIASTYLKCKDYQRAIEIYRNISQQTSNSNESQETQMSIISILSEQLKLYDKAIEECQVFLKRFSDSPKKSQIEFLLGKLAYLSKDYDTTILRMDNFCQKYALAPEGGQAMILAALSCMAEGKLEDAIARFKEVIEKHPKSELAAQSKFLIGYSQISDQKYSEALETFKQLIEQFPNSKYEKQAKSFIDRLGKISK